jgi:hypothetical protein
MAGIHAEEVAREEGGFVAAGAGADFDDGVAVFVGVRREKGGEEAALQGGEFFLEGGEFFFGEGAEFGIAALGNEGAVASYLGLEAVEFAAQGEAFPETGVFFGELLSAGRVLVEGGGGQEGFHLGEAVPETSEVGAVVHGRGI